MAAHIGAAAPERSASASLGPNESGRLLVVDDLPENRAILRRRLERRGFEVIEADGGLPALELIRTQSFDLVLLDIMMPDMDGLEALRRIRDQHSVAELPVIMVTGKGQSEDVTEALALGANDYVMKPVDFPVLLARANVQIARKRAEEALKRANEHLEARVQERTRELAEANKQLRIEMEQRERSQQAARYLAHHDALTGLGNRVLFQEQLAAALASARPAGDKVAVLFIDLDGFKTINDVLGHSAGDALLKRVAERLRDRVSDGNRLARLGGDEFAIIDISSDQPDSAALLASSLIDLLETPFKVRGQELLVGASIGIALSDGAQTTPERLLQSADLAMYKAKADGRGRYRFFEPGMDERAQARRALELDLRKAAGDRSFELHYQPIINLASSQVSGFEALLRWRHPERGLIAPGAFIPLAEQLGLIVPIGEWVMNEACREAAGWPKPLRVAVNLSPVQFEAGDVLGMVKNALRQSGLAPSRLELEITESLLLKQTEESLQVLNELRSLGVRVAMDDFGTGYSSLSYLHKFPFDKIKIDQSFVRNLSGTRNSRAILAAVCGLGRSLGIVTTAEGVETEEQLRRVREEGCEEVQGYFFSRPRPAHELGAIWADTR